MPIKDRKILIKRLLEFRTPGYNIELISSIFEIGITATVTKEIKSYQTHIAHNLHPGMVEGHERVLQDLHYISSTTGKRMHMILDQSFGIIHINTESKIDQKEIIQRLFNIGQILKRVKIKKNRKIFLYRNYITFKMVGQSYPIALS